MNNLPKNWTIATLNDVADYINGRAFKPTEWEADGLPIVRIQNLNDVNADYNFSSKVYDSIFKIEQGDLLFAWAASLGAYIWNGRKAWLNQHIYKVISKIDKLFLFHFLTFQVFEMYSKSHGSGMVHITKGAFLETKIPLPPLAEQGRIVAKIEELFAGIDAGVENLKSVKNQIALYRQSVLKSAFDGTLYKTTEWNIDVLKNLCSVISDGDHQPPPKAKNGIPFIMISNINKNLINFEDTNFVSENYYTSLSEKRKPKRGDVLYSVVGSYGIPVLIDFQKEFCFQRHIALLRPNTNKIFSKFLFYMLRSRNVYNQATDCSTGTAQKTVPLSGLREIHIPVPTLAEQERIVAEIESRFERADALEAAVDRALNDAEKLKQAVLKKAFSGELVPQNPDDEPASVLLDRIRAARASELPANPKKGKQKR